MATLHAIIKQIFAQPDADPNHGERLFALLVSNGYDTLDKARDLTDQQVKAMGVASGQWYFFIAEVGVLYPRTRRCCECGGRGWVNY